MKDLNGEVLKDLRKSKKQWETFEKKKELFRKLLFEKIDSLKEISRK